MRKVFSTERAIKAHRHKIIEKLRVLANGGTANDYTVASEESLRLASGPTNEKRYVRLNHPIGGVSASSSVRRLAFMARAIVRI